MDYDYPEVNDVSSESIRYETPNTQALLEYSRLDENLQDVYLTLSGKTINTETGKIMDNPYGKRLLNDMGVNAILLQLRGYFSRSATFNELSSETIQKKLKVTATNIKNQLLSNINMQRWELHQSDIEAIWECITTYIAINLYRSNRGGERNAITSSVQSKEVSTSNARPKNRSLFGLKLN